MEKTKTQTKDTCKTKQGDDLTAGRLIVEVDGVEYLYCRNFISSSNDIPTETELQTFADSIREYKQRVENGKSGKYITLNIDGIECKYYAGETEPTREDLEQYKEKVRQGLIPVGIVKVPQGVRAIYYPEAYDTPEARHYRILKALEENGKNVMQNKERLNRVMQDFHEMRKEQKLNAMMAEITGTNGEPMTEPKPIPQSREVLDAEERYLQDMIDKLQHSHPTYKSLILMPAANYGLDQLGWTGGKYNSTMALAAEAIDKAYNLGECMDTAHRASLRTIAEWLEMPYNLILSIYRKKHIL